VAAAAVRGKGGTPATLARLVRESEYLVLAAGLTDATRGLLDRAALRLLPDGATVVNVARGAIVDLEALTAEVRSGRLRCALDVTDRKNPLVRHPPRMRASNHHVGGRDSRATGHGRPRARRPRAVLPGRARDDARHSSHAGADDMIRLAFSTLGCPSWPLSRAIDAASRLGYDGVELRFVEDDDALWARPELTGSGLRETLAQLADAGLAVPCVDTRSFFHSHRRRRVAIDEAERRRSPHVWGPRHPVFGDRVQKGADLASTRAWIAECLAELRGRLRGSGVEVWLETHGDFATASATRSLLEEAGGDGLGAVWDPANAFSEFGEEPRRRCALGPSAHVHLKDGGAPGRKILAPGPARPRDFPPARLTGCRRRA
jgi:sugar phosphate isomerase/epimerase